ncbi:hypothetical protein [Streptococcus pneumoniae]|uniref:hypothetical protein n=1 Tax=Streptococcus pneumoniae TaxID=1313 RepID=UPI0005E01BD4|nr:hypothetical protein [Streptococcus pneumoniae]CIY90972.1 surface protein A [Streptococcus pneumoniae]
MNKKKMILTSLASVAVLGAGFVVSQPFVVNAYDNTSTVEDGRNQENALADASEKKLSPEELKKLLFDELDKAEKEAIEHVNADKALSEEAKAKVIAKIKAEIESKRNDIKSALEAGLSIDDVLDELPKVDEGTSTTSSQDNPENKEIEPEFKKKIEEIEKEEANRPLSAQFQAIADDLDGKIEKLKGKAEKAKQDVEAKLDIKQAAEETLKRATAHLQSVKDSNPINDVNRENVEKLIAEAKAVVDASQKALTQATLAAEESYTQLGGIVVEINALTDTYNESVAKVEENKKLEEAAENEKKTEELQTKVVDLEREVVTAQNEVDNLKKVLAGLDPDDDTEAIEAKLKEGEAKLSTKQAELAKKQTELEKLLDSLDPEGKTQDELDKEAELDNKVDALQRKVADLEKEVFDTQTKVDKLKTRLAGLEPEDSSSVEDELAEAEKTLAEKQSELEKTQKELDAALNELGSDGDEPTKPEKPAEEPENPAPAPKPEKSAEQQAEEDYARRSEEEYNRLTQQQPPKTEKPATPKTGWKQENGMWYFYNTDGSMATGWLQNNGSWYYLNANGSMATGWVKDGDIWYYLEASGAMKASQWFKVSDKWYYVNGLGALAVNTTVDGYRVNANGEWG